jgi:hypothetical protein
MARSTLFVRKVPGGAFHIDNTALFLGSTYYVNASAVTTGTTTGYGSSPDSAWSTLDAAWDSTQLAAGDLVLIAAGHTELVSAAAGLDCDTAGVYVRGLGWGNIRPTFTLDTGATTDVDIDAANIVFENLVFVANYADIAAAIDVNADGFTVRRCSFLDTATNLNALIWILGATSTTSDRITVEDCEFIQLSTSNTHAISLPGTSDRCRIVGNFFHGHHETSCIGAAGAITNCYIAGNYIQNIDTDVDSCISLAAGSTGTVAYNGVGAALAGNATTNITGGGTVTMIENYSVDTGDRQGVLDPVAT